MNTHDLKQLQVRKTKLEAELLRLGIELKEAQNKFNQIPKRLNQK